MDDNSTVVTFEGSQTIEKAEDVKKNLLSALKGKKKQILLDLSKIEKIDSSFLQLLYSANLEAVKKKKVISFTGEIPERVKEIMELSGFDKKIGIKPLC